MSDKHSTGERLATLAASELQELKRQISHARGGRDRAVHKARKAIQRLRAVVQLLRPVDDALARRENVHLQRLRRRLGPLRDAAARSETFRVLAVRKKWKAWSPFLRELAAKESTRHAETWARTSHDVDFWNLIESEFDRIARRLPSWPFAQVNEDTLEESLKAAAKRLRRRVRAASGKVGRELRHELRRKLRRFANLTRAAGVAAHDEREDAARLLSLAKRCGHEGDLWLALSSARRAARERPTLAPLIDAMERDRRELCARHDGLLKAAKLD